MKKTRIIALLMALLMALCSLPTFAFAKTEKVTGTPASVKSSAGVNVRSAPTTKYRNVITTLKGGTAVQILSTANGWCKITWGTSGNVGYMVSKYLTTKIPNAPVSGTMYVKTPSKNGVNMRTGASTVFAVIRVVRDGQAVQVLETTKKGWSKVKYKNQIGYIYSRYLSKTK